MGEKDQRKADKAEEALAALMESSGFKQIQGLLLTIDQAGYKKNTWKVLSCLAYNSGAQIGPNMFGLQTTQITHDLRIVILYPP